MRREHHSILMALALMCTASSGAAYAQSSAFPAYYPSSPSQETPVRTVSDRFPSAEPAPASVSAPTSKFPTGEPESAQAVPKPSFPVDGAEPLAELPEAPEGRVTFQELGSLLTEMNLTPVESGRQYDLQYRAELDEQEIELYFSLRLSNDQSKVRVRAWLDPLPEGKISEEHLLELLAASAEMDSGLHFAYSKDTRRFLLEKVIPSRGVTKNELDAAMHGVSQEVANTWLLWATSEWSSNKAPVTREAELDSRSILQGEQFEMPIRR
ncbi:hypothetical protein [Rubinisphaera margarita]|uniref:hypothetical protein n=1 Tax=Rubinisphaera margarita TaxID=2909586 RepID=UPI001EE84748|nr:hypothetical protein [Rubinisphaera margarita]MCG6155706.1 hypothetical protein [Rubinisphaera margarita]